MLNKVWVLGETPESYAALIAVGRRIGESVEAVCIGDATVGAAQGAGADAVLVAASQGEGLVEDAAAAVIAAVGDRKPDAVLIATTKRMRLVAARIAAAQKTRVVNDAVRVWVEDGALLAEHMVFGGSAYSVEKVNGGPAIVLLSDGLLLNESLEGLSASDAAPEELPAVAAASGITLVEKKPRTIESVNLAAARRVISVGRGIESAEDLQIVDGLAQALEAETGCTRPIAEGLNLMSKERYIGVSGVMLKPDLFVAVGLSGQVQHMVGAVGAKTIVAINKDKNAPVFRQADYGIVGDFREIAPKLAAGLNA